MSYINKYINNFELNEEETSSGGGDYYTPDAEDSWSYTSEENQYAEPEDVHSDSEGCDVADSRLDTKSKNPKTGASVRRKKWWMQRGKSEEEANTLCVTPLLSLQHLPEVQAWLHERRTMGKRQQSNDASPYNQNKEFVNTLTASTFNNVANPRRVGIKNINGPMSEGELQLLQEELLNCIDSCRGGEGPRFKGSSVKGGCLILTCFDGDTRDWLASRVEALKPWAGANLQLIEGRDLPRPIYGTAWIPDPKLDGKTILHRLGIQNPEMQCGNWRIANRKVEDNGQTVTFSFDDYALEALRKRKFRAFFSLNVILIQVKNLGKPKAVKVAEAPSTQGQPSTSSASAAVAPTRFLADVDAFEVGQPASLPSSSRGRPHLLPAPHSTRGRGIDRSNLSGDSNRGTLDRRNSSYPTGYRSSQGRTQTESLAVKAQARRRLAQSYSRARDQSTWKTSRNPYNNSPG